MPWAAYVLFAILAALFGYGIFSILTAAENPAHTTRLGNVRATPVEGAEPRPNRFALEDDMARLSSPTITPPSEQPSDEVPEFEE